MKTLATATRSNAEEVGIVRHLHLALFPCDVNTHRQPLAIGVVSSQGSIFRTFQVLLEKETEGGIGERQKEVIVRIEGIAVSGKAVGKQFQLVVGGTGRHDATLIQLGFQIGSDRSDLVCRAAYQDVEVAIDQLRAVHRQAVEHFLDVLLGNLVARVGHGAVALGLGLQLAKQFPLVRYLYHLVEHHTIGMGHTRQKGEQIRGDAVAVDVHLCVGVHQRRQVNLIYIHQRIGTDNPVTDFQILVRCLEVGHRERAMPELESHEAVAVLINFRLTEFPVLDVLLLEDVAHLGNLGMEVQPPLRVVLNELAALRFLREDNVGTYLRKFSSLKVTEVAFGQELRILRHLMVVGLLAEHVLFLQGIALTERLYHVGEHILKEHVLLRIGTELLHGIGYLENNRRFPLG